MNNCPIFLIYNSPFFRGEVSLKQLTLEHIKTSFRYSILDIYKSTTQDQIIIDRESWWKEVLQSRRHGYNEN
jgi:hypothetical protein